MGNRGGLGRRHDRLWVGLRSTLAQASLHTYTPLTPRFLHLSSTFLSDRHISADSSLITHVNMYPLTYGADDIIMYKRIATSPRSATCALLDEFKITATTRRNASRKSHSLYVAPYYMDAMDVI